jgi:DNA-binding transcriptional LysR family regulator
MKYHQLEAFYQVMLTGSISKAAKNLGRTQPAVSMTINTLEEQLGTALFERHAGKITPRAEAQILFEQTALVMQQLNDIRQRFGSLRATPVPRISIISSINAGINLVPSSIADIASAGQELRLMNAASAAILSEMENQLHDIAVTDEGTTEVQLNSPLFEAEVFKIPVCAIFPRGMIRASSRTISINELIGHQICMLYGENRAVQEVRTVLRAPRVEFSSFFPMACFAVANGSVAIADYVTCSTLETLTSGALQSDWRIIGDVSPSPYYLLRPRYRPRSKMADNCHASISKALKAAQMPRADKMIL